MKFIVAVVFAVPLFATPWGIGPRATAAYQIRGIGPSQREGQQNRLEDYSSARNSGQDEQASDESSGQPEAENENEDEGEEGERETLLGNWCGVRDRFGDKGLTIEFGTTYVFQSVAEGGFEGPLFGVFSDENDTGHTFFSDLQLTLDTEKAALWRGGQVYFRFQDRFGRSVLERAGTITAVNNLAIFPNVIDEFDRDAVAIIELMYEHRIGERVAIFGGLLNTAEGDANEIAGDSLSTAHLLNTAFLYSLVEDATVPNTSLGGGVSFEPSETISGSISVFGSDETAGENPFDEWNGTTFSTEWTFAHELRGQDGAQTLGLLYGIDALRTDIALDPRIILASVLLGLPIPATEADTWAVYYNAYQFVSGDANEGWGLFARLGFADGNPNLVKWNAALGMGGTGLVGGRKQDRWGLGAFYVDMSDEDLLRGLGVGDEVGGEFFYNIAFKPWFHVSLDAQVIESALPGVNSAWVLGMRTHVDF